MDQMIGLVGSEDSMMNQRVPLKGIAEDAQGPMHQIAVEGPLHVRGEYKCGGKSKRNPEQKQGSQESIIS
jgi:hypothetical protein